MDPDTFHVKALRCPYCTAEHDYATVTFTKEPRPPMPGDPNICIKCGRVSVYDAQIHLRLPRLDEMLKLANDPRVLILRAAWARIDRRRQGRN